MRAKMTGKPAGVVTQNTLLYGVKAGYIKEFPGGAPFYYPIWWHTAPMIIGTFLENYDLSGAHVYPFTQSASMDRSQFENSMEFVRESAAGANVHDGLFTEASDRSGILAYLTENGFVE